MSYAICDSCGVEFPKVAPGRTDCVCGGGLIFLDGDATDDVVEIPPERKALLDVLVPEASDMDALQALDTVIRVINHEGIPTQKARRAVGMVLGQYEEGLLTVMVGTARARTTRLMRLLSGMSAVEDKLMSPQILADMSPNGLLKLYRTLQYSFTGDVAMLRDVVEMRARIESMMAHGMPLQKQDDTDPFDERLAKALPPARRERLRRVFARVMSAAQGLDDDTHDKGE